MLKCHPFPSQALFSTHWNRLKGIQSIFNFLANAWKRIKRTFWDIIDWIKSALVRIYERLGDFAHEVEESVRDSYDLHFSNCFLEEPTINSNFGLSRPTIEQYSKYTLGLRSER